MFAAGALVAAARSQANDAPDVSNVLPHERGSVGRHLTALRKAAPGVQATLAWSGLTVEARAVSDDAAAPPRGSNRKKVYFIRHGQGLHNAAQKAWREDPSWDGKSEPYTLDTDPEYKLIDPVLTTQGKREAEALQPRAAALAPELMIVSPMRRATQTGLLAFEQHVKDGLPVVACELVHEISGKHTCDKRLPVAQLKELYPMIDYGGIRSEEDPFWGDGRRRERWDELGHRAAGFLQWLEGREEQHIVVACHSAILGAVFNAALLYGTAADAAALRAWYHTGEMRTVELTFNRGPRGIVTRAGLYAAHLWHSLGPA